MVYLLPLYHPLRLVDEICMLDQMSGGRFLYGVGRGISPVEVGFYGVDFDTGAKQFREAFEVVRRGLTEDRLTFHGEFYDFDNVPIVMKPFQQPLPVWYGLGNPASVAWSAARRRQHGDPASAGAGPRNHRQLSRGVEEIGPRGGGFADAGVNRHIIIAETEAEALATARRGYPAWRHHMGLLWHDIKCRSRSSGAAGRFRHLGKAR